MSNKRTFTIFEHCVPLPAPGPPRTNTTLNLDIVSLAADQIWCHLEANNTIQLDL